MCCDIYMCFAAVARGSEALNALAGIAACRPSRRIAPPLPSLTQACRLSPATRSDVLLEKHWRVALSRTVVDVLMEEVRKHAVVEDVPPVLATGKHYLFSAWHRGLFYVAVTSGEVPASHVIDWIHQLLRVLGVYLGNYTQSALAENFVIVYQLCVAQRRLPRVRAGTLLTHLLGHNPTAWRRCWTSVTRC